MSKNNKFKNTLYEYLMFRQSRAENNYTQWLNNNQLCGADVLDLLELMLALNEVQVINSVVSDLHILLKYDL